VFEVPSALTDTFKYKPGQHLQLHVPCGGKPLPRCYSLSSTPADPRHRVTIKRVTDGRASNWICASLKAGDMLEVAPPAGVFTPKSFDADFLMFAGGSGITPVFSIIRMVLASGKGRIKLVYANRDKQSIIFSSELERLTRDYPERLQIVHWLDSERGFALKAQLGELAIGFEGFDPKKSECFICGPGVFMDATAAALHDIGVPHAQVHIERFVSLPEDADDVAPASAPAPDAAEVSIEVELDGKKQVVKGRVGQLLIEALEAAGLQPPYSCRAGACAACMCHLEDGEVELQHNHALSQDDLDQGWILGCQAIMQSPKVKISYPN
jgi:3-ketosteroid 9alpha-monooxygenase subunit B